MVDGHSSSASKRISGAVVKEVKGPVYTGEGQKLGADN